MTKGPKCIKALKRKLLAFCQHVVQIKGVVPGKVIWGPLTWICEVTSQFEKIDQIIKRIPKGKVATYGQIAAMAGIPRGARTVGWALATLKDNNMPWHRVINAQGRSSFPEAAKRKLQQSLLEGEGVVFDGSGKVELELFQWDGR